MIRNETYEHGVLIRAEILDLDTGTYTLESAGQVVEQRPLTAAERAAIIQAEHPAPTVEEALVARLAAEAPVVLWQQPTGAHDAYLPGEVVLDPAGDRWRNVLPVPNVWPLDVHGWENLDAKEPVDPQPWVQPTGAHDAYPLDAEVTHNGQTWRSTVAANVWEPGVFGWVTTGS